MYKSSFQKRAFNLRSFITALRELIFNLSDWRKLRAQPRIDPGFSEKIMLAVTQVNDCRYCSYVHTRKALNAGVPQAEIRSIMGGDLEHSPQDQLVALVFAQHYAESAGKPDEQAFDSWKEPTAKIPLAKYWHIPVSFISPTCWEIHLINSCIIWGF